MPQRSYPYASGRIAAIEQRLLDKGRFSRLIEAEEAEALKLLREMGYGAGAGGESDVEKLILSELAAARAVVWEVTPDPTVTALFLLKTDVHNLKALLKARALGVSAEDVLAEGGSLSVELLQRAVDGEPQLLPKAFADALATVAAIEQRGFDSRRISAEVDRALFLHAQDTLKKHKNAFAKKYFAAMADFTNAQSVVRARALGFSVEELSTLLVAGGEISEKTLLAALELPAEQLTKTLGRSGFNGAAIARALDDYAATGSTRGLEQRMDAALIALVKEGKSDVFSLGPVAYYLLGREAEARALRLLFAAKRAGVQPTLPALYA